MSPQAHFAPTRRYLRYRQFVSHCTDGVWCAEFGRGIPVHLSSDDQAGRMLREGRINEANDAAAALHGIARGCDLRGRDFRGMFGGDEAGVAAMLRHFVVHDYHAVDATRGLSLTGVVERGLLTHVWGVEHRLPHRADVEGKLRQAQKLAAVGQVAGGVAHDFNNLLTAIMGYSELVRDALGPTHPCAGDIEQVLNAGRRAEGLARQLLSFSRGQRRRTERVDLGRVLRDFAPLLRRLVGDDIHMEIACDSAPAWVQADRGQLELVVMNLALNARDAMNGAGRLTIGVTADDIQRQARLRVSDTGAGIPADARPHIFEPFFTTRATGTGLGLATVHDIVTEAGGTIDVETGDGAGTSFTVRLPLTAAGDEHDDAAGFLAALTARESR